MKKIKPPNEAEHYNAIMIEDLHSKIDLVIEGLELTRRELRAEIKAVRNDVENQFSLVHAAIRCNADGIRELRTDMQHVKNRLDRMEDKMDHVIDRVDDHEARLTQANM